MVPTLDTYDFWSQKQHPLKLLLCNSLLSHWAVRDIFFLLSSVQVEVILKVFTCDTVDEGTSNVLANENGLVLGSRWGGTGEGQG